MMVKAAAFLARAISLVTLVPEGEILASRHMESMVI
jgi:hypothetical protein